MFFSKRLSDANNFVLLNFANSYKVFLGLTCVIRSDLLKTINIKQLNENQCTQ